MGDGARLVVAARTRSARPRTGRARSGPARAVATAPPAMSREAVERSRSAANRPASIRVSSHYPFERVNRRLVFDRAAATGFRLDLPAGSTERWAPGETRTVRLVRFGGDQGEAAPMTARLSPAGAARSLRPHDRRPRAARATPISGSGSRTTARRPAMSRSGATPRPSARARRRAGAAPSELDVVVAGALVLDPVLGVVKADIGIKDGRIVGVGRAGNPAISDGIELPIGPHTQPIMGYGLIATPGAVDSHVHAISPSSLPAALSGGVTTLITAGLRGAAVGDGADARRPRRLAGQRRTAGRRSRRGRRPRSRPLLDAGACGFKIHEDYGSYPELIDHVLRFADAHDVAGLAPHRRAARGGRARGHDRGHRRSDGPRLPRRGERRWPPARPARARPRGRTSSARRPRRRCRSA